MESSNANQAVNPIKTPLKSSQQSGSRLLLIILGILVLLLVVGSGAYYLGTQKSNLNQANNVIQQSTPSVKQSSTLPTEQQDKSIPKTESIECTREECLIRNGGDYLGFAILKGYYKKYDGTKWEWGNQKVTCDSLLTTGGSEKLINEFKKFTESGNTLNKVIDGNFLININLSELTTTEKALIEQSSSTSPVELSVIRPLTEGRGVSTCYSLVDIISVRSVSN